MSPSSVKPTLRTVVGSFVAGAGAMVLLGLVAPVAVHGGLSVRDAMASSFQERAPLVEPLDVVAIEAQLAAVDRDMARARALTADDVRLLARLSGR